MLLDDIQDRIKRLNRAEAKRKQRRERHINLASFLKNPYRYSKQLFETSKNGELGASKQDG